MSAITDRFRQGPGRWRDDITVLNDQLRYEPRGTVVDVSTTVTSVGIPERCPDCNLPLHGGRERRLELRSGVVVELFYRHAKCTGLDPIRVPPIIWEGPRP